MGSADDAYAATEEIMRLLKNLPWQERAEVIASIRYNGEFCASCGMDTPDGSNCHCDNDE